jgi:hypothetical protein
LNFGQQGYGLPSRLIDSSPGLPARARAEARSLLVQPRLYRTLFEREVFPEKETDMSKRMNIKGQGSAAKHEHEMCSSDYSKHGSVGLEAPVSRAHTVASAILAHEQIAARAYQLWEARGKRAGTDRDDWFEAERLLRAEAL